MTVLTVTAVLAWISTLCWILNLPNPIEGFISRSTFSGWCEIGAITIFSAWCFLWLPFRRHEIQEKAHAKLTDKDSTKRILAIYFKALDDKIALLKLYRREGGKNIEEAGTVLIEGGDLCVEIREFINEKIGPIEATIFSAGNDCIESIKKDDTPDFFKTSIEYLTRKLVKLKEIMNKQQ